MKILEKTLRKKKRLIVGLMSGTSADGIDAALVEIAGSGTRSHLRQLAFETFPYPPGFKQFLLRNSDSQTARLDDVTRMNMLVAELFADAVKRIVRKAKKHTGEIDLIGSHGQTIHHLPSPRRMYGKNIRATLQIGNPSAIAKFTGIVTVGDFRIGDIAVGGTGAPLVPLFDYLMLRSRSKHRAALNIGGIANITILPRNCSINDVLAFDTGPGNMIIDHFMQRFFKKPFDLGGRIASRGNLVLPLLDRMRKHPYFRQRPPKSTGREVFGKKFIRDIQSRSAGKRKEDIIATVTEFTALSIYQSYLDFVRSKARLDEILVSGGGVHNMTMMNALKRYFEGVSVLPSEAYDISSDAKEAICFALLANETIAGNPGNIPGATGAERQTVLGTICLP